ncbi:hypothetical protein ES702_07024 [subsurface metagenome]
MAEAIKRVRGVVKFYNQTRGFGFITPEGEKEGVFFHCSDVGEQFGYLQQNDQVEFEIGEGREGKEKAVKVKRITEEESQEEEENNRYTYKKREKGVRNA